MDILAAFNEFEEHDEDYLERDALGRICREYFPRVSPFLRYREKKFQARYRLTRNIAACLADDFGESEFATSGRSQGGGISHRDRFCLALRYFATGAFYSAIGDTQGVHKSTVCRAIYDVTEYLYSKQNTYICFPTEEQYPAVAQDFARMHGFPCIIGCVDGTHVSIQSPAKDERLYVDRNWRHSLNVMAICDAYQRFTYIDARFPGSSHDSFVFRQSAVGLAAERRRFHGFWFLGDSGYPLKPYLMTPILNPNPDVPGEDAYNKAQTGTRAIIEMAFGTLKQRFRCIDHSGGMLLLEPLRAAKVVVACCVLHNIAVQHDLPVRLDNDWDGRQRPVQQLARVGLDLLGPQPGLLENEDPTGAVVRRRLVDARFRPHEQ